MFRALELTHVLVTRLFVPLSHIDNLLLSEDTRYSHEEAISILDFKDLISGHYTRQI